MENQGLADPIDVVRDHRVLDHLQLPINLIGKLLAQDDLFFKPMEIGLTVVGMALADPPLILLVIEGLLVLCHDHWNGHSAHHQECHEGASDPLSLSLALRRQGR